ncbi:LysR substrate-binding domain-containing protein [Streptomyces flavofungini]|uniref:LysR substrate-binding domain-containing protein n=1 Tax=Streptomyces flavofungini TaxID=68200 RepID=UPI0025AF04AF|nr:LysR substrate-binding domain-containing protein [Streptomyces flavofungini]WJV44434.1 LysR substrate-binding domain-containing protein [Streptomyces flavofungini]
MTGSEATPSFRLAYVPGVTPTKWVRVWNERLPDVPLTLVPVAPADAVAALRDGTADAGLVRLPVDRTVLSAIPLYTETTVVVVPKDHVVTAADEVGVEDLADEIVLHPQDDTLDWESLPGRPALERPATTADAIELVAAGIGVLAVPQSLARLHHRKDLTYRPVTDAPQSGVVLSWPEDATTDLVEEFIGIIRGRTVNSTRGRGAPAARAKDRSAEKDGARRKSGTGTGKAGGKQGSGASASGKGARKASAGKPSGGRAAAGRNPRRGTGGSPGAKRGKPRRRS